MSRSGYVDEYGDWAWVRWRGMVASAVRGKRGQECLQRLLTALDNLPTKRLIAGALVSEDGADVCALGALGIAAGQREELVTRDPYDFDGLATLFNIDACLAQEIMWRNDDLDYETPEARWHAMRAWVRKLLP